VRPGRGKRQLILRAAAAVFARRGYHGASMAQVAEEAGVAAGTIYLYFAGKEQLLVTLVGGALRDYLEECRPLLAAAAPGAPRLRRLIELHLSFFERDPDLARLLMVHLREADPAIQAGIAPALRAAYDLIEEVLRAGVAAGAFDPGLDPRLARKLLAGGLEEVVSSWVLREPRYSLLRVLDPLHRMAARAMGAKEQHADRHPRDRATRRRARRAAR
jgi:TetR/AcrR family fatty acid metabolism transcriptional regulator